MKDYILILLFFILLSCNLFSMGTKEIIEFKELLTTADLIEISYGWWGDDGFDINVTDKEIKDSEEIDKIVSFFSEKKAFETNCGYDGNLDFKKNGNSLLEEKVLFNIKCERFVFAFRGKYFCFFINDDGIKYFQDLYNKLKQQRETKSE